MKLFLVILKNGYKFTFLAISKNKIYESVKKSAIDQVVMMKRMEVA